MPTTSRNQPSPRGDEVMANPFMVANVANRLMSLHARPPAIPDCGACESKKFNHPVS